METSIREMQWVLRAQCRDREALEALLRSVQPSLRALPDGPGRCRRGRRCPAGRPGDRRVAGSGHWTIRSCSGPGRSGSPAARRSGTSSKRRLWQGRHEEDAQLEDCRRPKTAPSGELLRSTAGRRHDFAGQPGGAAACTSRKNCRCPRSRRFWVSRLGTREVAALGLRAPVRIRRTPEGRGRLAMTDRDEDVAAAFAATPSIGQRSWLLIAGIVVGSGAPAGRRSSQAPDAIRRATRNDPAITRIMLIAGRCGMPMLAPG